MSCELFLEDFDNLVKTVNVSTNAVIIGIPIYICIGLLVLVCGGYAMKNNGMDIFYGYTAGVCCIFISLVIFPALIGTAINTMSEMNYLIGLYRNCDLNLNVTSLN